mgnify:CR=1 FL=1
MDRTSRAKEVKAAYERVFESEDGKIVLSDLIDSTGLLSPSVNLARHQVSEIEMAFNDGAKSIVCRIIDHINLNPEKFVEILKQKSDEDNYEI